MKPSEMLTEARAVIAERKRWTRLRLAEDKYGNWADTNGPAACRWCAEGALDKVLYTSPPLGRAVLHSEEYYAAHAHLSRAATRIAKDAGKPMPEEFIDGVVAWVNDNLGYEAVLVMYDEAIKLALEDEAAA